MLLERAIQSEPDESDAMLMVRYAAGDARAFDELFQRYEPRAYAFFLRRTHSPQRAEDLYQDLFLRIHQNRNRYDPQRAFAPWFFQIANHLLIDDYRRAFRSHELPIDGHEPRAGCRGSEAQVADAEQIDRLLLSLSAEERYVVLSAKVGGSNYSELAAHLGKSVVAVKKMASRAIQRLRSSALSASDLRIRAS